MKKVKIVLGQSISSYDEYSVDVIRAGITDWEEISDEEYRFLKANITRIVPYSYNWQPMLVVQDDKPIAVRITELKKVIATEQKKMDDERVAREAKKKEKELKRALKSKLSKEELFNQLKAELGK